MSSIGIRRGAGLLAVLGSLAAAGTGAPAAGAARSCAPPKYPSVGYFVRVTVTGVPCATGSKVAVAYYRCRTRTGNLAGRCAGGVLGYRCHEVRNAIATEIDARVTCTRGRATVVHVYQQFLTR
jgi:hypothetical protein